MGVVSFGKNSDEEKSERVRIVDGMRDGRGGCSRGGWVLGGGIVELVLGYFFSCGIVKVLFWGW